METTFEKNRITEDFLIDLQEFVESEEMKDLNIDEEKIEQGVFKITSKEQANFFLKQVAEIRKQKNSVNAMADDQIQKITDRTNRWREKELNTLENQESYFSGLLQEFAESELTESKKKSLKLPEGSVGFRNQQDKYEYDDKILLTSLKSQDLEDYISYKPSPNKTELKKAGKVIDGKLYLNDKELDGVTVTRQDPKFEVKITE